jgi:hypothetical protein
MTQPYQTYATKLFRLLFINDFLHLHGFLSATREGGNIVRLPNGIFCNRLILEAPGAT